MNETHSDQEKRLLGTLEIIKGLNTWPIAIGVIWVIALVIFGPSLFLHMMFDLAPGQELPFWIQVPFYVAPAALVLSVVFSRRGKGT